MLDTVRFESKLYIFFFEVLTPLRVSNTSYRCCSIILCCFRYYLLLIEYSYSNFEVEIRYVYNPL